MDAQNKNFTKQIYILNTRWIPTKRFPSAADGHQAFQHRGKISKAMLIYALIAINTFFKNLNK